MSNAYNFNNTQHANGANPQASKPKSPSMDLLVIAPLPAQLGKVDVDTLKPIALSAFVDHYNNDTSFRGLLEGYSKGTYQFDKNTDNLLAAQSYQSFCNMQSGPYSAIANLSLKDLLPLFAWLRKQTKTSPTARISIARREYTSRQAN